MNLKKILFNGEQLSKLIDSFLETSSDVMKKVINKKIKELEINIEADNKEILSKSVERYMRIGQLR
ncbi:hypothetical protein B2H94_07420 [Clostridium sporogenes]|uniref:Uncharacterized protein n=1 Tax=Clostridium sporogenes TaxID=1509 RepID=A0ABD6RT36_CLOSG|nr:hypothetical protein [Clostridium sporogenes]OSB18931.1 hypothetical protein B2H94_07420 [Clostridium sporogenes]